MKNFVYTDATYDGRKAGGNKVVVDENMEVTATTVIDKFPMLSMTSKKVLNKAGFRLSHQIG